MAAGYAPIGKPVTSTDNNALDSNYKYGAIVGHDEFRVLSLLPGAWEDNISCTLQVVSLSEKPSYRTISYAWGDAQDTRPVRVHDSIIRVPANLELALRHLRHTDISSTLWADSLCINQKNFDEKTQQVTLMGRIYRECASVYIWLGAPCALSKNVWRCKTFPNSSAAARVDPFTFVRHFSEDKHIHDLACFRPAGKHSAKKIFSAAAAFETQWNSFLEPVRSSWWSRVWCVQEALLPPDATVVFGHWRIPSQTIQIAALNHRQHMRTCCAMSALQMPERYYLFFDTLVLDSIQMSRYGVQSLSPDAPDAVQRGLDWHIRSNRHKDCKDPRDRVFGVLGLVDQIRYAEIVPDYSLDVSQVYIKAMTAIIAQSGLNLQCLTGSGFGNQEGSNHLPSWVRNLAVKIDSISVTYERLRMQTYDLYTAMGDFQVKGMEIENDKYLQVRGVGFDKIREMGRPITQRDWRHVVSRLRDWHRIAGIRPTHNVDHLRKDPKQVAFWTTVLADVISDSEHKWHRLSANDIDNYIEWIAGAISAWRYWKKPSLEEGFVEPLLAAIYNRSFFRTEDGKFGLCFPTSRVGDEVWILAGARVPFVLRAREGSYILIGEAYVHGAMDGEGTTQGNMHKKTIVLG
jgi:hypothetical protein